MTEPRTREELEQTTFFQWGQRAKKERKSLAKAIAPLRFGTWQYDAFIEGYDSPTRKKQKTTEQ